MRHAKAVTASGLENDFDRNLNDRGKIDAAEMGRRLKHKGVLPDVVLCSAARRTQKTARIVAHELGYPDDAVQAEFDLYNASVHETLQVLRNITDEAKQVLLVGHNPAITSLVGYLTGAYVEHVPTAGVALVHFPIKTWKQLVDLSGKLDWFDFPKSSSH